MSGPTRGMSAVATEAGAGRLLSVRNLVKRFGPTTALDGADFELREREIHALVGCSGAGKSTLLDIVSGLDTCDSGEIIYRGYPIKLRSRRDALRIGIAVVAQRSSLIRDMTVFENIAMPHWGRPHRHEPPDLRKRVTSILSSFGWSAALPLDTPVRRLSPADGPRVEIARAFAARAKVFVLDEPFASLSGRDIDSLLGVMMRLRMSGCGIIVAGGRLEELAPIADRVTILCEGRTTVDGALPGTDDHAHLRRAMGRAPERPRPAPANDAGAPVALMVRRLEALPEVRDVSLSLQAGEIVGLYGLRGAGCGATLGALGGLRPRSGGIVEVRGDALWPTGARNIRRAGMALAGAGLDPLLPQASARQNLRLVPGSGRESWPEADLWRLLDLPADALEAPAAAQPTSVRRRIALAGALAGGPAVLLAEDPCGGLDAPARGAMRATLREAAARGLGIVMTAGDLDDLLAVAHRIVVLREGCSVADLPAGMADTEALTLLASPAEALARNTAALAALTQEHGGAAFWALRRTDHVVCLNAIVAEARSDPGLRAGQAMRLALTRIPHALKVEHDTFVTEPDGARSTLLVPIRSRRGRDMGWMGLTLVTGERPLPPASAVAFRIDTLAATL